MIQDQFLAELKKAQIQVTIFLVSGIRLQGTVESSDQYGVLLRGNSQQFIFKRAISTIVPSREVGVRSHPAGAKAPQEFPAAELHSAGGGPAVSEIVAERKEPSTTAPVVRVKRASGSKLKLAKGAQA